MIELRPANCKELMLLWELRTRAVAHACAAHYSAPVLAAWLAAPAPDSLQQHVGDGGGTVAIEDGRLLGYAVLDAASGEVDAVFVEPAHQGRGIGAMLMRRLEAAALAAGHNQCGRLLRTRRLCRRARGDISPPFRHRHSVRVHGKAP